VGGRKTIAAGMLDNTPENLGHWISDPQGVKVGSKMIVARPSDQDLATLVAYLQNLK
jgi:cytochrome c oxidase subunit 2